MIKHQLSFAQVNLLNENLAEIIIDANVLISLEMAEEYEQFVAKNLTDNYTILVNKINHYDFSFEAKLSVASHENLTAIAVVTYNNESQKSVEKVAALRQRDGWNLRIFNGLSLGRQKALQWLQSELHRKKLRS
ncbi:hypothetical protein [Colwellia ponticola]|uniref:Uncharacterized protein n=1 Tax=Colwellia ponticola TaxID=2304625 RepID=A0A8H2JPC2_9GAMM|nr:hypothetical protein [Colwellia ponticola]TMM47877.1 hypothetical protein FCS21_02630 [Colwellia ponticola]